MTLGEEGCGLLEVSGGETEENHRSWRNKRKDLVRFLGVESTALNRRKDGTLRSLGSSLDSCSYSSSQIYSTIDFLKSSRNNLSNLF